MSFFSTSDDYFYYLYQALHRRDPELLFRIFSFLFWSLALSDPFTLYLYALTQPSIGPYLFFIFYFVSDLLCHWRIPPTCFVIDQVLSSHWTVPHLYSDSEAVGFFLPFLSSLVLYHSFSHNAIWQFVRNSQLFFVY